MVSFIYLHGLFSSSKSKKGQFFKKNLNYSSNFITPDFYPQKWEFEKMTISYLLEKVEEWVNWNSDPIVLIGSSFGGLIATRFCQLNPSKKVIGLILLAPALDYYDILTQYSFNENEIKEWRENGFRKVNHPSWSSETKWSSEFLDDLEKSHHPNIESLNIPTLIIHGTEDKVIPIYFVKKFIENQSKSQNIKEYFIENEDHYLYNSLNVIKDQIEKFSKSLI